MTYASTINPAIPAASSALASAPIRANFAAAQADVNALAALIGGGGGSPATQQVVTASYAVTVLSTDEYIEIANATPGATTVNLPASPATNQKVTIKDGGFNCSDFPINLVTPTGLIDQYPTLLLNTNGGAYSLHWNGANWRIV